MNLSAQTFWKTNRAWRRCVVVGMCFCLFIYSGVVIILGVSCFIKRGCNESNNNGALKSPTRENVFFTDELRWQMAYQPGGNIDGQTNIQK